MSGVVYDDVSVPSGPDGRLSRRTVQFVLRSVQGKPLVTEYVSVSAIESLVDNAETGLVTVKLRSGRAVQVRFAVDLNGRRQEAVALLHHWAMDRR